MKRRGVAGGVGLIVNIALVVGAIITVARLAPGRIWTSEVREPSPPLEVGSRLSVTGLNWEHARRYVVLVVSTTCPACQASAPFYRRLSEHAERMNGVSMVALAPESAVELQRWLDEQNITVASAHTVNVDNIGITEVPTIALLDGEGVVTDVVQRALDAKTEDAVIARLHLESEEAPLRVTFRAIEVRSSDFEMTRDLYQVLRVMERTSRRPLVSGGFTHIPLEELSVRAPAELSPTEPIAIDCVADQPHRCRRAGTILVDAGFADVVVVLSSSK